MSLRRALAAFALGTSLVMLAGCGNNAGAPTAANTPGDTAPPSAPIVTGSSYDLAQGTDVLAWSASASVNVVAYEVYMYSPDPARDNSYVLIGETDASSTHFALPFASAPASQYLRVKARSAGGARSAASAAIEVVRTAVEHGGGSDRDPGQGQRDGIE